MATPVKRLGSQLDDTVSSKAKRAKLRETVERPEPTEEEVKAYVARVQEERARVEAECLVIEHELYPYRDSRFRDLKHISEVEVDELEQYFWDAFQLRPQDLRAFGPNSFERYKQEWVANRSKDIRFNARDPSDPDKTLRIEIVNIVGSMTLNPIVNQHVHGPTDLNVPFYINLAEMNRATYELGPSLNRLKFQSVCFRWAGGVSRGGDLINCQTLMYYNKNKIDNRGACRMVSFWLGFEMVLYQIYNNKELGLADRFMVGKASVHNIVALVVLDFKINEDAVHRKWGSGLRQAKAESELLGEVYSALGVNNDADAGGDGALAQSTGRGRKKPKGARSATSTEVPQFPGVYVEFEMTNGKRVGFRVFERGIVTSMSCQTVEMLRKAFEEFIVELREMKLT
jgi:hypothetical protein